MISPLVALIRLNELESDAAATPSPNRTAEAHRLTQAFSTETQHRYLRMRRRYGATAIVPVERGICMGCFMRQPAVPKEIEEDVYECQNCGRFLYEPEVAFDYSVG
jgi:predicted  nucleic acid-binding Zn-ribbon protein